MHHEVLRNLTHFGYFLREYKFRKTPEKMFKIQFLKNNSDPKKTAEMMLKIQSLEQEVESLKYSGTILYILVSICSTMIFVVFCLLIKCILTHFKDVVRR